MVTGVDGTILARIGYTVNGEAFARGGSAASGFAGQVVSPEAYLPTDRLRVGFAGGRRVSVSPMTRFGARDYAPRTCAWVKPDPYNFAELSLPEESRNLTLAAAGLKLASLVRDPAQQYRYGYVSGNSLNWIDPSGLSRRNTSGLSQLARRLASSVRGNYNSKSIARQNKEWNQNRGEYYKSSKKGGTKTNFYQKNGDYEKARNDFDKLGPRDVKTKNGTTYGTLKDGSTVNYSKVSKDGRVTLERRYPGDKLVEKVRYNPNPNSVCNQ